VAGLVYYCVPHLSEYGECPAFIPRFEVAIAYHLHPYQGTVWAYGPALFEIPILFMKAAALLGGSHDDGFMFFYAVYAAVGQWSLFYVVDRLRIKVLYRVVIFSLVAASVLNVDMGIHETLLRNAGPFAGLLIMHKACLRMAPFANRKAILAICGINMACALFFLALSPEVGIAYIVAQMAYGLHRAVFAGRGWIFAVAATLAAFFLWLVLFPGCLTVMIGQAKGAYNFPVVPAVFILIYLLSLIWIVPLMLGKVVSRQPGADIPLLLGCAVLIVATTPAALGRCDGLHVLLNGVGAFVLAFAGLAKYRPRLFPLYAILFCLVYTLSTRISEVGCRGKDYPPIRMALAGSRLQPDNTPSPLIGALDLQKFPAIATPFDVDRKTRNYLIETRRLVPQYHLDYIFVRDQTDLDRIMKDLQALDKRTALLVPDWILQLKGMSDDAFRAATTESDLKPYDEQQRQYLGILFLYPSDFVTKHRPFQPILMESRYIANHYQVVHRGGGWALMMLPPEPGGSANPAARKN
jgi:hypothetical protein